MNFKPVTSIYKKGVFCLASATLAFGVVSPSATLAATTPVDLELSLLVDGSGSIESTDFALQLNAYRNVFNDPSLFDDNISKGKLGRIAVNLIQFSNDAKEEIPFTLIDSVQASQKFASQINSLNIPQVGLDTNLAAGINLSTSTLLNNQFDGASALAIDISTDGFPTSPGSNPKELATQAAKNALNSGVGVINAIAVGSSADVEFLKNNIVGGTNASLRPGFVVSAKSFQEYEDILKQKIVAEVRQTPPQSVPEPASILSLAMFGTVGAVSVLKRKYRQTEGH